MRQMLWEECRKAVGWRLLAAVLFLVIAVYFDYNSLSRALSVQEFVVYEANEYFNICFYMTFFLLLLSGDLFSGKALKPASLRQGLTAAAIISALEILIYFILIGMVNIIMSGQVDFSSQWTANAALEDSLIQGYSPWTAFGLSFLLLFFRALFLNSLTILINQLSGRPYGFFAVIGVLFLDWWFYELFDIAKPLFLLPIEHSRLPYTEAAAPAFEETARCDLWISILYWLALIGIVMAVIWSVAKFRAKAAGGRREENGQHAEKRFC